MQSNITRNYDVTKSAMCYERDTPSIQTTFWSIVCLMSL